MGVIIFILNLGTLSLAIIKGKCDGEDNFLNNFCKYIKNEKAGFIILRFFLSFIFLLIGYMLLIGFSSFLF